MIKTKYIDIFPTTENKNEKSTARLLTALLGISEKDAETVYEVPTELRWRHQEELIKDTFFVYSQQKRRYNSLNNKIEYAVSTIPLTSFAINRKDKDLSNFIKKDSQKFKALNIILKPKKINNTYIKTIKYLKNNNILFKEFDDSPFVALKIMTYLEKENVIKPHPELHKLYKIIKNINIEDFNDNINNNNKDTFYFNLYRGPGSGKTTTARILYRLLNISKLSVELIDEVPKQMVWERDYKALSDQLLILSQQKRKSELLNGEVDIAISDSPLGLQHIYGKMNKMPQSFHTLLDHYLKKENSINIFLEREHPYQSVGRIQSEKEANSLSTEIKDLLHTLPNNKFYEYKTHPFVAFQILKDFHDKGVYSLPDFMIKIIKELESNYLNNQGNNISLTN